MYPAPPVTRMGPTDFVDAILLFWCLKFVCSTWQLVNSVDWSSKKIVIFFRHCEDSRFIRDCRRQFVVEGCQKFECENSQPSVRRTLDLLNIPTYDRYVYVRITTFLFLALLACRVARAGR